MPTDFDDTESSDDWEPEDSCAECGAMKDREGDCLNEGCDTYHVHWCETCSEVHSDGRRCCGNCDRPTFKESSDFIQECPGCLGWLCPECLLNPPPYSRECKDCKERRKGMSDA